MKLDKRSEKTFNAIRKISDESFSGIENPPVEALRYNYESGDVFLWTFGERIDGFAIATMDGGKPYLWSIAVANEARRCGIGGRLIKEVATFFKIQGWGTIDLTVNGDNPAQKLYFDHGFRVVKVIPHFYGEQLHGLRMRRPL